MLYSNCHLGPFPTSTQKLECVIITGRVCYHSAPTCLSTEPSQFPLAFCTTVLMEPKAVSINKTLLLLFSQGDNSFPITNKPTILACKYAQTRLSLNNSLQIYWLTLYHLYFFSFCGTSALTTSSDNELIKCTSPCEFCLTQQ